MFNKLLLTTALLVSSTFGGLAYVDPDFSTVFANRSEALTVDENGVTIDIGQPKPWILRRLTESDFTDTSNSINFKELADAVGIYALDIISIKTIYTTLTAATTLRSGISKEQDAELLYRLFWNRVSILNQTLQAMLLSPQLQADDSTGIIVKQHKNLTGFLAKYDPADKTPFMYGNLEKFNKITDDLSATYGF